ncbi:uncharacterized protein LOC112506218 [Cynara cardunculus var. scolymus]|uniref:uncharacterized protein LOC112506218 n=1 Tax=Cynara cardunculus var. scolymus TaxID=59895 RepID=UPI000D62A78E|nr:uncharacterized protein LOC112506218 [Cynara cardunculus var. scolymus]
MDLDHALRLERPVALADKSLPDERRAYELWDRSNSSIFVAIRGAIPDSEDAKTYLNSVEDQFKGTSKAHASILILKMLTTKYNKVGGVREHIMMMTDMANKLKSMNMEISESFLVHFIITSLPSQFCPFKINYNTQRKKWKMNELIAMYVQEEERLKVEKSDVTHLTTTDSKKRKGFSKGKGKTRDKLIPNKIPNTSASTGFAPFKLKEIFLDLSMTLFDLHDHIQMD